MTGMIFMKTKCPHFLITRFNIRSSFNCKPRNSKCNPTSLILDSEYLNERFRLFETYTFFSIKNQTCRNFRWIILFHEDTPLVFKDRIKKLKTEFNFIDLYFGDDKAFNFENFVKENDYDCDRFITSRIDNDDMVHPKYIELVQAYAAEYPHRCILTFEQGEKLDTRTGRAYRYDRIDNHFLSMIASKEQHVLQYDHSKILQSNEEIIVLPSLGGMWTEVVHEMNFINDIKEGDLSNKIS